MQASDVGAGLRRRARALTCAVVLASSTTCAYGADARSAEDLYYDAGQAFGAKDYAKANELFQALLVKVGIDRQMRISALYALGRTARELVKTKGRPELACEGADRFRQYLSLAPEDDPQHSGPILDAKSGLAMLQGMCDAHRAPAPRPTPQPAPVTVRHESGGGSHVAAWLFTVGALGGVATGATFLVLAGDSDDEARSELDLYNAARDPEIIAKHQEAAQAADDEASDRRVFAYVSFGGAAVFAGLATWLFLRDDGPAQVAVVPTRDGAGLTWVGTW